MPEIIKAEYRIVTPMFIGDAEQKATGISPASIKGALRFWWRALNWGRVLQELSNEEKALRELYKQEGELFGSSAESGPGQSKFLLRIIPDTSMSVGVKLPRENKFGIQYLLGQGLYHHKRGYLRESIEKGAFIVECIFRPTSKMATFKEQIVEALLALGTLGGMGSRARKGFGSVVITSLYENDKKLTVPETSAELIRLVQGWQRHVGEPPFSAFSSQTRIDISLNGSKEPIDLLNEVGMEQQMYRSYGRKGPEDNFHKVNGKKAEQIFSADHHLMLDIGECRHPDNIPQRSVFGLPHNYFFPKKAINIEFGVKNEEKDSKRNGSNGEQKKKSGRRASPLFIHVHRFPNGNTVIIQSFFPARYLPDNCNLEFEVKQGIGRSKKTIFVDSVQFSSEMINWRVIHDYLDRFVDKEQII